MAIQDSVKTKNGSGAVDKFTYHHGFGSSFRSEAVPDSLPKLGHTPQNPPYNLYTEGLTGSAFTAPRNKNRRSWLYRIRPSVVHYPYEPYRGNTKVVSSFGHDNPEVVVTPQQLRWDPLNVKGGEDLDFVDGLRTLMGNGNAQQKDGAAIHFYQFGKDMDRRAMYSADGDILFLPVNGELLITTEFGKMHVPPNHIAVVQRNMKFSVKRVGDHAAGQPADGYAVEVFKGHYELPELGPIGGNGLANIEDFQTPTAAYEDEDADWNIVAKYQGKLFQYVQGHSPFDVVAWMGNYVPFKYDLSKFNTLGSVSFDHPDPSLQCCLTVPSDTPGTSVLDFMAFGPRWSAVENTFRPQWFHRNVMSEWVACIQGYEYPKNGCNLHNIGSGHGPSADVTEAGYKIPPGPMYVGEGGMMVMVETYLALVPTKWAIEESGSLTEAYWKEMWQDIKRHHTLPASG